MQLYKKLAIGGLLITGISSTILLSSSSPGSDLFEISKNIDIFTSVYKELNTYYVDDIDANQLMRTGIDAMLESLDPYTNYISEAEMEGYKFQITGNYGGIGATIRPIDGKMTVVDLFKGFPADKAGLLPGDIILEIDQYVIDTEQNDQSISELLRGSPGTNVELKVYRPFVEETKVLELSREEINMGNVPYYGLVNEHTGYIILSQFTEDAGRNVADAFKKLKEMDPELSGLILDLRGNPGGLLREAVNVSNIFIDKGLEVVSTRGRVEEWDKSFLSINSPIDKNIPLVVLTSSTSASASEIVAGVIQDYDRGVIVGQKTFGKGLVQTTRDVSYKTKLKLTTAKYYIPSGRCIQAIDYAHKNADGSAAVIPDSLKVAFQTKGGRPVYDGGGIDPDIKVEESAYRDITYSLLTKNLIFHFATWYYYQHPEISEATNFSITENDYTAFVNYLSDKDYDYTTGTEELLAEFEASAKKDAYYEAVKEEITHLQDKVTHDKENDLYRFKDEILFELNREIAGRYYNYDGRIEVSFRYDPDIQAALNILNDQAAYNKILNGNK
jgi:carboxyl-terminal processing protease